MNSSINRLFTLASLSTILLTPASAAVIAGWDNDASVEGSENWASSYSSSNLTVSTITTGTGIAAKTSSGGPSAAASMKYEGLNATHNTSALAFSNNAYLSFTISANSGFQFDLTSIQIADVNMSAPSTLNLELRSSADGFASALATQQTTSNGGEGIEAFNVNLSGLNTAEMRIYLYWESGSGNIHLRNDKTGIADFPDASGLLTDPIVLVNGSVIAIPEPTSAALLGLCSFALILRRKK